MKRNVKPKGKVMTRKEIREKEKTVKFNPVKEIIKIMKHFFPNLISELEDVVDPRDKRYITYGAGYILLVRIMGMLLGIESMRGITVAFNGDVSIENFQSILKDKSIEEIPHYDTINDFLSRLNPDELAKIRNHLISRLIRMKCFESYRFKKRWLVSVDGSGVYSFKERHCEHCLTKTHRKGTSEEYTEYFHHVLEAKLTIGDMVFNIGHEFIENEKNLKEMPITEFTEKIKQDCELKAFYRLKDTLKRTYPRLPICFLMDSLYANKEIFNICKERNWEYIIRFKEGSIPTVAREFKALADFDKKEKKNNKCDDYRYVNEIDYESFKINVVEYKETRKGMTRTFTFITSPGLKITDRNKSEMIKTGRLRWKIENQGFNEQKNHGYALEHTYSHNYTAMKNHYMLIQIAHMIRQLFENGIKMLKDLKKSLKDISFDLKVSFITKILTDSDLIDIESKTQIRFDPQ